MKQPEVVRRTLKYSGPAFAVYTCLCRDGHDVFERDIIERRHGVVVVPIHKDETVLLVREYCAGPDSFVLSLPGGSVEAGRSLRSEAVRELREETGFAARHVVKLRYAFSHPSVSSRRSHVFLAYDLFPAPLESPGEILSVVRLPLDRAIRRVYQDFVSDVSTIGNLLMARERLPEFKRRWRQ